MGKKLKMVGAAALTTLGATAAMADTFVVPPEIGEAATNVGLVGAAVFAVAVAIKVYKWFRASL